MIKIRSVMSKIFLFSVISLLFSSSAFAAAGTMNYSAVNAVPTLSGTMLLILSLLLFVVAMKIAKNKNKSGNKFFIMTAGLTVILLGAGGVKIVSEVQAGAATVAHLDSSGTVNIPASSPFGLDYYYFANEDFSGGITISSIVADEGSACGEDYLSYIPARPSPTTTDDYPPDIPDCEAGLNLGIEQACKVVCGSVSFED